MPVGAPVLRAKWPGRALDEGFVPFPKRLIRALGKLFVGPTAIDELRVILAVVDYNRPNLTPPASVGFLAFNAGMTSDEVETHLKAMAERGWIVARRQDDRVIVQIDGLIRKLEELTDEETVEE